MIDAEQDIIQPSAQSHGKSFRLVWEARQEDPPDQEYIAEVRLVPDGDWEECGRAVRQPGEAAVFLTTPEYGVGMYEFRILPPEPSPQFQAVYTIVAKAILDARADLVSRLGDQYSDNDLRAALRRLAER